MPPQYQELSLRQIVSPTATQAEEHINEFEAQLVSDEEIFRTVLTKVALIQDFAFVLYTIKEKVEKELAETINNSKNTEHTLQSVRQEKATVDRELQAAKVCVF